ncbi:nucleotide exchange factor GrpE, partial [Candidatus Bipolaricaulota bacterium]|nr:nucleotide exchange factor GrpE [Candidatus Bipolaricaulota bacterium]
MTEEVKEKMQGVEAEEQELPTKDGILVKKEEEIRSYVDRLKRLQAEFENYKKRGLREMANLEERISDREILDFLPLYDNLQRAFTSFSGNNDAQSFIEGIEQI